MGESGQLRDDEYAIAQPSSTIWARKECMQSFKDKRVLVTGSGRGISRLGEPANVAEVVAFLATEEAR